MNNDNDVPTDSVSLFSDLLELHKLDSELDVQMIPATVLWGRKPGKEAKTDEKQGDWGGAVSWRLGNSKELVDIQPAGYSKL